jgi:uncharacterized membrane protein (DUF373 family)
VPQSTRRRTADVFRLVEHGFYTAIAFTLALAGALLFASVTWTFVVTARAGLSSAVLHFLDGVLLVFIVAEIIHTIRTVIHENVLRMEPFLIVGIVAAIRRFLVITGEATEHLGGPLFRDRMLEMGVLVAAVLALGATVYLVRHTDRPEPAPTGSPDKARPAARG